MTPADTMRNLAAQLFDDAEQPRATSDLWPLPALIAGAGLWAVLVWLCPVAAGLLLMVCGVAMMVGA